ncbi:hypothetical protein [Nonomuraea soli]|uniref:Uncharacterized protein n=1 Tax=Nonomuraea soli TaxID=1032476 RepID=A0A7W0CUW2_9ACTN|nr:hypothetical protein [Nonomuraea soli]MBA2897705.1 hypothetical protein [Nonomuraea soli]
MVAFNFMPVGRPLKEDVFLEITDGDIATIQADVRMVSIDTPEKERMSALPRWPGQTRPLQDPPARRHLQGPAGTPKDCLVARHAPDAAARHIAASHRAADALKDIKARRLTKPDGSQRKARTIATGELIESNGRILGYLVPWFTGSASDPLPPPTHPDRRTFNLDMVAAGWAATFVIFSASP